MTAPGSGPILVTDRLRLVPFAEDDIERIHALLIEPGVRRYLMDDEIVERPWVVDLVESSRRTFADANLGLWRIEAKRDGAFVGFAGLRATLGAREPQLLYALDPALWGRGFATEASAAVADYAFDELGFQDLLASTDPPNHGSIRVMERLGMRFLEALRERAPRSGGHPLVLYRMSRADWQQARVRLTARATASGAASGSGGTAGTAGP